MAKQMGTYDLETGEIGNNIMTYDLEDEQRSKKYIDKRKSDDEFKMKIDDMYGSFYFLFYNLISNNIEKQYIFRFLYLCTFMDYENHLLFGSSKKENKYMIEKDFKEVMKLGKTEANKTKLAFIDNELMFINDDGYLQINDKYCLKGKIEKGKKKESKIRVFETAIKELYEKAMPREHKKLTLLITILPYINYYHNVVCHNPTCEFRNQLKIINLKDICEMVKYSDSHISRLKKELLALRVGGELVVMFNETDNAKFITINPRVYYKAGASSVEYLDCIAGGFEYRDK